MKILIYGFKPFGKHRKNITGEVIDKIPSHPNLVKHIFETNFDKNQFLVIAEKMKPDLIIGTGQYPQGDKLRLEQVGYNRYGSKASGIYQPIMPGGRKQIEVTHHLELSYQVIISRNPGKFVCNYSIYILGSWCQDNDAKFCFVHIPKKYPLNRVVEYLCQEIKNQL